MNKKFYAVGNDGGGSMAYVFVSKVDRDRFVFWNDQYSNRKKITKVNVVKHYKQARLLINGQAASLLLKVSKNKEQARKVVDVNGNIIGQFEITNE